jgi:hypothetical protein
VKRDHLSFEDPALASGSEGEILDAFRRVRDLIRQVVENYLRGAEGSDTNSKTGDQS